jgi:hypothetical protein
MPAFPIALNFVSFVRFVLNPLPCGHPARQLEEKQTSAWRDEGL